MAGPAGTWVLIGQRPATNDRTRPGFRIGRVTAVTGWRKARIFCRLSCSARRRADDRRSFATVREALLAGYRPCDRCEPLSEYGTAPSWMTRVLKSAKGGRLLDPEIRSLGLEPARVRRYVDKHCGRMEAGTDDTATRLSEMLEAESGQDRGTWTATLIVDCIESPLGVLLVAAREEGVCLVEFTDRSRIRSQIERVRQRFGRTELADHPDITLLQRELRAYFAGTLNRFTVPTHVAGTPFQQRVWNALERIPYGETRSYEGLADTLGATVAQRAVGRANATNPLSIVIPCHRLVNKSGQLAGYGGLLWRKQALLCLERTNPGVKRVARRFRG